jgi:proteasome lid subunit RPN8/RPN11
MKYTVTITGAHTKHLLAEIFSKEGCEGAAYLLCGPSSTAGELRLLVREVVPVLEHEYLVREPLRLSIDSASYARIAKRASADGASVLFVHSHPKGIADFSPQDNREEPKLMAFLGQRAPNRIHGSLVVSGPEELHARAWVNGEWTPIKRLRSIGTRFRFLDGSAGAVIPPPEWFDRQVAAFGPAVQGLLSTLHVGVVGCGGTGSAVAEQLCRVGVGTLSRFDGDKLDSSNVTRVYGSRIRDAGQNKVDLLMRHLEEIGLETKIIAYPRNITVEEVAKELRSCDLVFGCTDLEAPRALLVQLALRYLIPVFDVGVKISSEQGTIRDITGRVTTLLPGEACLFCRGRISADRIRIEQLAPEERRRLVAEGYAQELDVRNPAVIMFTTSVAAQALMEFMHRITGYMGAERASTEVLPQFHNGRVGKNREPPGEHCVCRQTEIWGRGDSRDFLGVTWAG